MKLRERKGMMVVFGALVVSSIFLSSTCADAARVPMRTRMNPQSLHHAVNRVEKEYEGDVIGMGEIRVTSSDMTTSTYAVATASSTSANGNVVGNGVRLRKLPKTTAAVLELMYNKESVCINYTKSAKESNGNWYYVKRVKTGTWGWVNYKYLSHWD